MGLDLKYCRENWYERISILQMKQEELERKKLVWKDFNIANESGGVGKEKTGMEGFEILERKLVWKSFGPTA